MSITLKSAVYGINSFGKKVKIGYVDDTLSDGYKNECPIFYIDPDYNGCVYHFFDKEGEEIIDLHAGDIPYAYSRIGTPTKDKYYIFYPKHMQDRRWTYYENGSYKTESVGGTSSLLGNGKSNTSIILSADNGKYVTNDSNEKETIWYSIMTLRNNNIAGRNDWYIGSKNEYIELKNAKDRNGDPVTTLFETKDGYSSSEITSNNTVWTLTHNNDWQTTNRSSAYGYVPIASF